MKKPVSTNISSNVMEQIKGGRLRMRPKLYYAALGVISAGAIALIGLVMSYLFGIIFFWIRIQTSGTMAWGARANLGELAASFPWWALLLAPLLLITAVWLVRRQGRLYRHKTSTLVLAIIVGALLFGFLLSLFDLGGGAHTPKPPFERGRGPGPRSMNL